MTGKHRASERSETRVESQVGSVTGQSQARVDPGVGVLWWGAPAAPHSPSSLQGALCSRAAFVFRTHSPITHISLLPTQSQAEAVQIQF